MGIRFSRKSPARGSMDRQSPAEDLIETEVRARTAVSSRSWESAAAEASRVPPARDTGEPWVGVAGSEEATRAEVMTAEELAEVSMRAAGAGEVVETSTKRVTVVMNVEVQAAADETTAMSVLTGEVSTTLVGDATRVSVAEIDEFDGGVVVGPVPKVKD